jgi:hypothetical protein
LRKTNRDGIGILGKIKNRISSLGKEKAPSNDDALLIKEYLE